MKTPSSVISLKAFASSAEGRFYPALLSGYAAIGDGDKAPLRALAHALTALFVRYNVIGGRETTVMETTIYEVASKLRTDKDFDAAVDGLAELTPDAQEFIARFARASVGRITTARYLLREIEHAKRKTLEVSVEGTNRVHVEHIYPQTPAEGKWPNHSAVINRLGNLTLLGKRFNTSIKNADFPTKKAKAYAASDILMTKELIKHESWDTHAITERQAELSTWALAIWSFPGEVLPANTEVPAAMPASAVEVDNDEPEQLPEVPTG